MEISNEENRSFYIAYNSIDPHAYRERVRFYDENKALVQSMNFNDYFEVDLDYYFSLFEIGKYDRFLSGVDRLLEQVIIENINIPNRDVFKDLLFKKAASLYNLWKLEKAEKIIGQLCRIDADYPSAKALFLKIISKKQRHWNDRNKAFGVVSIFILAAILLTEHLIITPFYGNLIEDLNRTKLGLIIFTVSLLILNEIFKKLTSIKEVDQFIND